MAEVTILATREQSSLISDATIDLLTSSGFITAVVIGIIGVIAVMIWAVAARRPAPHGGLILTAGIAIAIATAIDVPLGLLVGLAALAIAGFIPTTSSILTMAMLIPGAVALATTQLSSPRTDAAAIVAIGIVLLAPLVASFDERYASSTVATPLVALSILAVFATVPDTEVAVLAAGAALPWLVAGPPIKLARLGRAGAFTVVGTLMWLVVEGGFSRPVALAAGVATLGVLVLEPLVTAFTVSRGPASPNQDSPDHGHVVLLIVAQAAIIALISIVVRV